MILVGELALWIALLMAAWGAIVSFAGGSSARADLVASGERAIYATFVCLALAIAGLLVALVTSDFSFHYVAAVTSANLPAGYKVTALWAGKAGAVLSWALMLSMCAVCALAINQTGRLSVMPYVTGALSVILLFFLAVLCLDVNPYERLVPIPVEGRGLNPDLQHPAVAVHPPTLYLGYAAAAVPFAFATAALLGRKLDEEGILAMRRWATLSWFLITIGIITGMWWTYVDAGGGGDWLRDPIERWSLFPWLAVTASLYFARGRDVVPRVARYTLYAGVTAFLIACAGFAFRKQRDVTLGPGDVTTLTDPYQREWTFTSQGLSDYPEHNRAVEAVPLRVTRAGRPTGLIVSERHQYLDGRGVSTFEPSVEPGIDHSFLQDTHVVLTSIAGDRATVRITFYPLIVGVWIGGLAIAIGGAMLLWPASGPRGTRV